MSDDFSPLGVKPCAICRSSAGSRKYLQVFYDRTGRQEQILRCRECRLVYVDEPCRRNRPFEHKEGQSIVEAWESQFPDWLDVYDEKAWGTRLQNTETVIATQVQAVEQLVGDRLMESEFTLLELGPGRGYSLAKIRERYPRANLIAIEPSPVMSEWAKKSGVTVINGIVETAGLEPHSLDAVIGFGVFIQIRDPLSTLRVLNRALKPRGRFLFDSPNDNSVFRWLARLARSMRLEKLPFKWGHQVEQLVQRTYNPGRFYFYTEQTFAKLLALAGLEVTDSFQKQARFVRFGKGDLPLLVRSAMKGVSQFEKLVNRQSWVEVRGIKVREVEELGTVGDEDGSLQRCPADAQSSLEHV